MGTFGDKKLKKRSENMKALVIGSGGREHAIAWLNRSDSVEEVYVWPGNPFTLQEFGNLSIRLRRATSGLAAIVGTCLLIWL